MEIFLSSQRVLYQDFRTFVQKLSGGLKARAEQLAQQAGRPWLYLSSAQESQEEIARRIQPRDRIAEGPIGVRSGVEPGQSLGIRRDREKKQLRLVAQQRQCLHFYFYYLDREFGWMHLRLQSWLPLTVQVCVHGQEWLARAMDREGIAALAEGHQRRQLSSRVTRQLALLCAHGLIYRVLRPHYYRTTRKGQEVMTTALEFRTSEVAVLAA